MCRKIYGGVVLLLAIVLAVFVVNASVDTMDSIMRIMKFFDVMIPILAVGALVKYLFCGHKGKCGKCGCDSCKCCSTGDSQKEVK